MKDTRTKTAEELLSIGAVFLRPENPFTWTSGIKSPIYCDNRLILTNVEVRNSIVGKMCDMIMINYPEVEVLMGTSTAGIPHSSIAGHILGLPCGYVRGSAKEHGRTSRIEGRLLPGQKVVVIEDLISTAGSAIDAVNALREAGAQVLGIASIYTYGMQKGLERLKEAEVKNVSLTDFDTTIKAAARGGYIDMDDIDALIAFRDNPSDESWIGKLSK